MPHFTGTLSRSMAEPEKSNTAFSDAIARPSAVAARKRVFGLPTVSQLRHSLTLRSHVFKMRPPEGQASPE
jgi:hypothetical protein